MDELPHFARRLRELRMKAGLSQYALARKAGLTKQALSRLELGQRGPVWETVQRLALALGVDCGSFTDPDIILPEESSEPPARPGRPRKPARNVAPVDPPVRPSPVPERPKKPARRKQK